MSNYPTNLDDSSTLPNPIAGNFTTAPDHAVLHSTENDAIKAVETKLGTGTSTSTSNTFLIGNGTGTSVWSNLSSVQLAARISDGTGTGAVVFASSPTIVTPTIASFVNANHTHQNNAGGGTLAEAALSMTDITTNDVSITKHGFTPKAPNDITKFLRGDATYAVAPTILSLGIAVTSPADATTYFNTSPGFSSGTSSLIGRFYIPTAGTITSCYISAIAFGTVGTSETSTLNIRVNDTTDTAVNSTVILSAGNTAYNNIGLSIVVVAGDFIQIKLLTPTWATNPGSIGILATVKIT